MTRVIFAIDPGPTESGYALFNVRHQEVVETGIKSNYDLKQLCNDAGRHVHKPMLAIEMIACYGMPVGSETFETCLWIGRFEEAFDPCGDSLRCYRKEITLHICGNTKARDSNVRQALIDRLGKPGTKKSPGPTYNITSHMWSALAVAVYAADQATLQKQSP